MRTIQKEISLEQVTSRLPSVWPSYHDGDINEETNEVMIYYFDDESLSGRSYEYTSNWNMIPLNIVVTPYPDSINEETEEDLPLNDRKYYYSAYTLVDECSSSSYCHCYTEYVTTSGTPTHCFDDSGNTIECEIDKYGDVISGHTPYYFDETCRFVLSFERLSKWYYFFNEYYNLLKQYGHCNRVYTSAEDYYNYESLTKYADQMIYGSDKQTYLDLDQEFFDKGGKVEVLIFDKDTSEYKKMTPKEAHDEYKDEKTDRMAMVDVYDVGFFKWICDNVVPSFIIPMRYKDYWKVDRLYYPDVIKWLAWFAERVNKYESKFKNGENGEVDTWECRNEDEEDWNCCDCEEYFKRGGERVFKPMKEWYDSLQNTIKKNNEIISSCTNCFVPTMILPTNLQVSIDDLGEKSIFSNEYELGINYRTARYGDSANTRIGYADNSGGTVSAIDGRSMILFNGSGYSFDATYMEKYVSSCKTCNYEGVFSEVCPKCGSKDIEVIGWGDYTDYYINHDYTWDDSFDYNYKKDFYVSAITYYAYDSENVKYTSNKQTLDEAEEDLKWQMSKKYPLTLRENGWILIDEVLYPIDESEYAEYDKDNKYLSGRTYMVFREPFTNTPYTYVNGKKIYAELYNPTNVFYFPFFKKDDASDGIINDNTICSGRTFNIEDYIQFERTKLKEPKMFYIKYNDKVYQVENNTLSIDDVEYYRISGYTSNDGGEYIYCTYDENNNIRSGEMMLTVDDATVETNSAIFNGEPYIKVDYPFDIISYKADEINGRTVSKLEPLRLYNVLSDDIGRNIDGIYNPLAESAYNHQPPQGTELELLYQVGNTANISRFRKTAQDLDEIEGDKNYFVGDIITEMKFYYKEYDDTIPSGTVVDVKLESGDTYTIKVKGKYIDTAVTSGYTSLSAITASTSAKTDLEKIPDEVHVFYDNIFCDVTYYIGATLRRKEGENYNLCYEEGLNNHGVEYKETVEFVKEHREYYLRKPKPNKGLIPTLINKVLAHSISYPIFVYKLKQNVLHVDESQYDSSYDVPMADFRFDINIFSGDTDTFSIKYSGDMETHNGLQVFPTFREEYRFGNSMIENIDSDIYIDRGINAAFEKHLKLGEAHTLEALEQFGNGYFKIMDN